MNLSVNKEGLGYFQVLSLDVLHLLLQYFPITSLGRFALCSKQLKKIFSEAILRLSSQSTIPSGVYRKEQENFVCYDKGDKFSSAAFSCANLNKPRGRCVLAINSTYGCSRAQQNCETKYGGFFSFENGVLKIITKVWYSYSSIMSYEGGFSSSHHVGKGEHLGSGILKDGKLRLKFQIRPNETLSEELVISRPTFESVRYGISETNKMWKYWNQAAQNHICDIEEEFNDWPLWKEF